LILGGRTLRPARVAHGAQRQRSDRFSNGQSRNPCFAGDLVFLGHIPVARRQPSRLAGRFSAKLATLPRATCRSPVHGPVGEWPAALSDERRYLDTIGIGGFAH